jgi:histidinol dehydrogenase
VIDAPAGPSEVLVLADSGSYPRLIALELLAQSEHDPDACAVLLSTSEQLGAQVEDELAALVDEAPRSDIVRKALATAGALLWADSLDEAIDFANRYAPEHLSVMTENATDDASRVQNAGSTFVGHAASVAFGDYITGANHVLPTAGRARSFSGLSTHHFLRSFTVQEIDGGGAAALARDTAILAEAEGLPGHAAAALARRLT